jgi:hypothetical protein
MYRDGILPCAEMDRAWAGWVGGKRVRRACVGVALVRGLVRSA